MSVLIDYEAETEEEEDDETDISRPEVERNRQVKRDAALPCWKKWLLIGPYSETSKAGHSV